jgi:Protein of unknown function (DUF1153)
MIVVSRPRTASTGNATWCGQSPPETLVRGRVLPMKSAQGCINSARCLFLRRERPEVNLGAVNADEFLSWQHLIDRHGLQALRATRVQDYRE